MTFEEFRAIPMDELELKAQAFSAYLVEALEAFDEQHPGPRDSFEFESAEPADGAYYLTPREHEPVFRQQFRRYVASKVALGPSMLLEPDASNERGPTRGMSFRKG